MYPRRVLGAKITEDSFPIRVAEPTAEWHLPDERERIVRTSTEYLWQRCVAWLFLATGVVFFLIVRGTRPSELTYVITLGQAGFLVLVSQAVLLFLYIRMTNNVTLATGLRRLRAKVPDQAELELLVEIYWDGTLTGKDHGYMWLNEGTWYFKGLETAFRFNQQDVLPVEAWPKHIAPDPSRDKAPTRIPMKSKNGELFIKLFVDRPYEDFAKRKRVKAFYREMYDWLHERPRGTIESLLPPRDVHPSLLRKGWATYEGVIGAGLMVVADTLLLLGLPREGSLGNFGLLAGLVVAAALVLTVRFAWAELRDVAVRSRLCQQDLLTND